MQILIPEVLDSVLYTEPQSDASRGTENTFLSQSLYSRSLTESVLLARGVSGTCRPNLGPLDI